LKVELVWGKLVAEEEVSEVEEEVEANGYVEEEVDETKVVEEPTMEEVLKVDMGNGAGDWERGEEEPNEGALTRELNGENPPEEDCLVSVFTGRATDKMAVLFLRLGDTMDVSVEPEEDEFDDPLSFLLSRSNSAYFFAIAGRAAMSSSPGLLEFSRMNFFSNFLMSSFRVSIFSFSKFNLEGNMKKKKK
jgi:hypothetical protein